MLLRRNHYYHDYIEVPMVHSRRDVETHACTLPRKREAFTALSSIDTLASSTSARELSSLNLNTYPGWATSTLPVHVTSPLVTPQNAFYKECFPKNPQSTHKQALFR